MTLEDVKAAGKLIILVVSQRRSTPHSDMLTRKL